MKKDNDKAKKDYVVGYGKPPKSGQIKVGECKNPKGRPTKKESTFEDEVLTIINKKVIANEGGKKVELTKRQLLIEQIINMAIKGNPTMARLALPLLKVASKSPSFEVQPEDEEALRSLFKRMGVSRHENKG